MTDLHTHTIYSDGKNTPEEMINAAIDMGVKVIGISDHSYTAFDESYCIRKTRIDEYKKELYALKEKYCGKADVRCGIEQDFFSDEPTDGYEYVIGSVHYIKAGKKYITVDYKPQILTEAADTYFGGDIYSLAEEYFNTVSLLAEKIKPDIIGHFDLISKFNENGQMFKEDHPRYRAAWKSALDKLLPAGIPFEINTGAMSRGYRTSPYPSPEMRRYIIENGGRLVLSSDAHSCDTIAYKFSDMTVKWL